MVDEPGEHEIDDVAVLLAQGGEVEVDPAGSVEGIEEREGDQGFRAVEKAVEEAAGGVDAEGADEGDGVGIGGRSQGFAQVGQGHFTRAVLPAFLDGVVEDGDFLGDEGGAEGAEDELGGHEHIGGGLCFQGMEQAGIGVIGDAHGEVDAAEVLAEAAVFALGVEGDDGAALEEALGEDEAHEGRFTGAHFTQDEGSSVWGLFGGRVEAVEEGIVDIASVMLVHTDPDGVAGDGDIAGWEGHERDDILDHQGGAVEGWDEVTAGLEMERELVRGCSRRFEG